MLTRRTLLTGAVGCACSAAVGTRATNASADDDYALDDVSRTVPKHGRLVCPDVELTMYRGKHLPFRQAAKIFVGFEDRLALMEKVAKQTALDIFGRAPHRLSHIGTFNCRRISAYPTWISEHGLGNAIDIEGFDFLPLKRGETLPTGVPRQLRGGFAVRVQRHWKARNAILVHHEKFLRTFAERLIDRRDIFRVLLGPGYPGHHNHFHFDCAPFRMVQGFEEA